MEVEAGRSTQTPSLSGMSLGPCVMWWGEGLPEWCLPIKDGDRGQRGQVEVSSQADRPKAKGCSWTFHQSHCLDVGTTEAGERVIRKVMQYLKHKHRDGRERKNQKRMDSK